jgi:hypothetical protein
MLKMFISFCAGAGLVYAFLVYPQQSRKVVKAGVDTATNMVAEGTAAATKAADQQLSKK